jgi:hypothetical protein
MAEKKKPVRYTLLIDLDKCTAVRLAVWPARWKTM